MKLPEDMTCAITSVCQRVDFRQQLQAHSLGIDSIGSMFTDFGYTKMDMLSFPGKKLTAYWYAPPKDQEHLPRVFISELKVRPCVTCVVKTLLWHQCMQGSCLVHMSTVVALKEDKL